jgi:hypothetical protein
MSTRSDYREPPALRLSGDYSPSGPGEPSRVRVNPPREAAGILAGAQKRELLPAITILGQDRKGHALFSMQPTKRAVACGHSRDFIKSVGWEALFQVSSELRKVLVQAEGETVREINADTKPVVELAWTASAKGLRIGLKADCDYINVIIKDSAGPEWRSVYTQASWDSKISRQLTLGWDATPPARRLTIEVHALKGLNGVSRKFAGITGKIQPPQVRIHCTEAEQAPGKAGGRKPGTRKPAEVRLLAKGTHHGISLPPSVFQWSGSGVKGGGPRASVSGAAPRGVKLRVKVLGRPEQSMPVDSVAIAKKAMMGRKGKGK